MSFIDNGAEDWVVPEEGGTVSFPAPPVLAPSQIGRPADAPASAPAMPGGDLPNDWTISSGQMGPSLVLPDAIPYDPAILDKLERGLVDAPPSTAPTQSDSTISVQGPNGIVIQFPAGTDRATIDTAMREATGIGSPSAREYVQGFAGGVNRGAANMIGLPGGIVAGVTDVPEGPGPVERLVGEGSVAGAVDSVLTAPRRAAHAVGEYLGPANQRKAIGTIAEAAGVPREQFFSEGPDTTGGRLVSRIGEEVGAAALPAAGMLKAAGTAARTLPGTRTGVQEFLAPMGRTPGRALAGETAATVGAGVGAGIAQEVAPGNVAAEVVGQLAGGFAPSVAANSTAGLGIRAGRGVAKYLSPSEQAKRAADNVKEVVGGEMTPQAQQSLAEAERLRREMPGFDPTLPEATGSPALVAQQRRLEQEAGGVDLERVVKRRTDAESAVTRYANEQGPPGVAAPDIIVDLANRRVRVLRDTVSRAESDVDEFRRGLAGDIPRTSRADSGATIRAALNTQRQATQQRMSALADELGINDSDVSVPFRKARSELVNQFSRKSIFADPAAEPEVLRVLRDLDPNMTLQFRDLKALRERVSDDLIDAIGASNPNRAKVRALTMMKQKVDTIIDDLTESVDPTLADRYRQFRGAYLREYVNQFENPTVFKLRNRDGRGFYQTPDERVADAFFAPDKVTSARQFNSLFRDAPEANAALESVALDSLADYAVREGVINPRRFQEWTRKHASVLREFPALNRRVASIGEADQALVARQAQLADRRNLIEDQVLSRELRSFEAGTKTGEDVIKAALREPRKMAQLVSVLRREPDALSSLRRNIWDRATEGTAQDILKFTDANNKTLVHLFTPQHLAAIKNITAARLMLERVPSPTGSAFEVRPLEAVETLIGQGLPQISSRIFAFKSGRMQKGYLAVDTVMRGLRGRAKASADDAMRAALYDPEVAKEMARAVTIGGLSREGAKRLHARMFALGVTAAREDDEE